MGFGRCFSLNYYRYEENKNTWLQPSMNYGMVQ
jgi:hypothetical protein